MKIVKTPNYLFDAVVLLNRAVSGEDAEASGNRLSTSYGRETGESFKRECRPLVEIQNKVMEKLGDRENEVKLFFERFNVFDVYHPIGCSIALLIVGSDVLDCKATISEAKKGLFGLTAEQRIRRILRTIIMFGESYEKDKKLIDSAGTEDYMAFVGRLDIPSEQKWKMMELLNNFESYAEKVVSIIEIAEKTIEANIGIAEKLLNDCLSEVVGENAEPFRFASANDGEEICQPSLFAFEYEMALTKKNEDGSEVIVRYIGVLNKIMKRISTRSISLDEIISKSKVIADKSRLEILGRLKKANAYGQELADEFGLFPTTVYHHMARLIGTGLVDCTMEGTKSMYSLNREGIKAFLGDLQSYLLD